VVLRGGQDAEERRRLWNRLEAGEGRFIIANPEVLLTEGVMRRLPELGIAHLVLDEAHCVSEWGESFRPSYLRIHEIAEAAGAPLLTAFTATASPPVLEKIRRHVFGDGGAHAVIGNPDRPNIDYAAKGAILRDHAVLDLLRRCERPAVVFCGSRARTERLARFLRAGLGDGEARFYHAGLERSEKDDVERWFFESETGVLAATCAYGMGVDKADIRTVIHRDCPPSVEAYLQESGRAGRDGKPARAILLWGPEDERAAYRIAAGPERERFDKLLAYGRDATACRRDALLGMLGAEAECCGGEEGDAACDVCRGAASPELREKRSLVDFIGRNKRRYTLREAAAVIAAALGDEWTDDDIGKALRTLVASGELRVCRGLLWKGKLTLRSAP
jgi:ATP-dependent DNA helicase RecQ